MPIVEGRLRAALYLPASNARALAKARTLPVSLVILDLEDSVPAIDKTSARDAAVAAVGPDFPNAIIRVNAADSSHHDADVTAVAGSAAPAVVVPKVDDAATAARVAAALGKPIFAMIETPKGVFAAREIAAAEGVIGLIAGGNDLAKELRLPPAGNRPGLHLSLQMIVLAARAAGVLALDGVFNGLEDAAGLEAECLEGKAHGFDGKTLIHPNQVETANRVFGPTAEEVEDAEALVAAARDGAERFRGRMIENMHVATARDILAEAARFV
ncbi:HpcH/HpaI aldolase/citrate lyase family protein [Sphingomonas sp. ID0503]|uniref:HpcH/HpaI aldolase/citrate lyase family protein n=1 Tax=Sphingomonas sp. ID0503 TaxID=3399691 RepID=UPI003AFA2E49